MKIVRGFVFGLAMIALMGLIVTPSWALERVADHPTTVGDFLTSCAKALRIELPPSAAPAVVVAALRASGVNLDENIDTSKPLTQADVVKISKANGIRVTTRSPQAAFSAAEIDQFFATYVGAFSPAESVVVTTRTDANENGHSNSDNTPGANKGKKKGHVSPTEPE